MKKRLKTIAVAAFTVLGVAVLLLIFIPQDPDGISLDNFKKIKKGMPRSEVHELLGPPTERTLPPPWQEHEVWRGNRGTIKITYDLGQVDSGYFTPSQAILNRTRELFGQ